MENISPVQPENYSGINNIPAKSKTNPLIIVILLFFILLISAGSFVVGKYFTENKTEPVLPSTPIVQNPTAIPTTDPTSDWKTLQFDIQMLDPKQSAKKVSVQIPYGWGIIINMHLGTFIQITEDEKFDSGGVIQIKENEKSPDHLQISIDQTNGMHNFYKNSNNPIFDQILSTFKFLD